MFAATLRCSSAVSALPALIQCEAVKRHNRRSCSHCTEGKLLVMQLDGGWRHFLKRKRKRRKGHESNLFCRVVVIGAMLRQLVVGSIERLQLPLSLLAFLVRHPARGNATNGDRVGRLQGKAFISATCSHSTHFSLCLLRISCVALSASAICSFLVTISSTDA